MPNTDKVKLGGLLRQPYQGEKGRISWALPLGIGIAMSIGGYMLANQPSTSVDFWFSAFLLFWGVIFTLGSIKAFFDMIARHKLDSQHKDQAWLVDHPWDLSGAIWDPGRQIWSRLGTALFIGSIIIVLIASTHTWGALAVVFPIAFCSCIAIGFTAQAAYLLAQRCKYGISRLRFLHCPFDLGGNLEIELLCEHPIGSFDSVKIELRCIQERVESQGDNAYKVCYRIYADEILVKEPGEQTDTKALPITFQLPESSVYRTRLSAPEPCYWELEITTHKQGVRYGATFLVPVYSHAATATSWLV